MCIRDRLYAIDAATGDELWQYEARLPEGILPCCDVINRGAAIYGDKVYFGTLDAKVVALDRKTGKVVWSKKVDDYKEGYTITAAVSYTHLDVYKRQPPWMRFSRRAGE